MKLVAAPRSAIRPTIVKSASPMRLLAPPPKMNPAAAGYSQRGQRFFSDEFADIPLPATQPLIRIR